MNDNNNSSVAGVLPLLMVLIAGVAYQKRELILKIIEALFYKLMWLGIYVAIAYIAGWALYKFIKLIKIKLSACRDWIRTVEDYHQQYDISYSNFSERIKDIRIRLDNQGNQLAQLRGEIRSLRTKFEPKKEVIQAEAAAKVQEAAKEVVDSVT